MKASAGRGGDPAVGGVQAGVRVALLTRAGCHLCDDAREAVVRVTVDVGVGWKEIDISTSADLADAYGDRVPVILVDGREHGYWKVEETRLRRALTVGRWGWSRS